MKPQNVTCPECSGPMVSRMNRAKQSRFWGCANYPTCKGTRNTDGDEPRRARDDEDDGREAQDNTPSLVWKDNDRRRHEQ
jgi:ssDNA-binding Zn-finger/Zn-ribbon topoisomerase 1